MSELGLPPSSVCLSPFHVLLTSTASPAPVALPSLGEDTEPGSGRWLSTALSWGRAREQAHPGKKPRPFPLPPLTFRTQSPT